MKINNFQKATYNPEEHNISNTLRYIAVFQLKYFSDIIMKQTKEAFNILCECEASIESILNKEIAIKFDKVTLKNRVFVSFHAEKIIFSTSGNTNVDCVAMLTAATAFLSEATGKAIFLAGYITYGHFYLHEERQIMCGKPYVIANQFAENIKINAIVCDKIIKQNLEEARLFTKDDSLFSQLGKSLIFDWDVPLDGSLIQGGIVKKEMFVIDWPRYSLDIFEAIRSYTVEEFYTPFQHIHGNLETLDHEKRMYIDETLLFLNHCLSKSVSLFNSTI